MLYMRKQRKANIFKAISIVALRISLARDEYLSIARKYPHKMYKYAILSSLETLEKSAHLITTLRKHLRSLCFFLSVCLCFYLSIFCSINICELRVEEGKNKTYILIWDKFFKTFFHISKQKLTLLRFMEYLANAKNTTHSC